MPLYYYRAPFTYKYTMTTLYIFYSYQSISNYTIYDYLYTITPYIWIYSMAIAHIYSIITLYIVTSCLPLAFRGFAAIGDWKGLSPSKHLYMIYFDDFLLILQKSSKMFEKSSYFGKSYIFCFNDYPLTLQLLSNLYLMIFTFSLKNLPKIFEKSSKLHI